MLSKKLIAIIGCFFFLLSCKEELKLEFSDINVSTDNNDLVEVNIPFVTGNTLISNKINAAISKNVISALHIGNAESITSKSIEESIAIFNQEYDNFKTDFPETVSEWEAQIDGEVMFQSSEIISLAITKYIFTGGAHGILTITFLNFNAQTGNSIKNVELFNNLKSFKTLAKAYFDKTLTDKDTLFEPENFELPANIGYNDEGIVLLYNTYEIAPYSTGIIEFLVPFEEAKPYLVFNSL